MSSQEATTLPGGFTPYRKPTPEDLTVFNEAMQGFIGVKYTPQTVSSQIVAGTNYRFKCIASIPPADVIWEAVVEIFEPLQGKPYITGIIRL